MAKAEYKSAVRSREKIITALVDLLQEKPLDKITVTDVVKRADVNRGTFYAHYRDIPDVIEHQIQALFGRIKAALPQHPGSIEEVTHAMLMELQMILEEDLEYYRKVMVSSVSSMVQQNMMNVLLDYLIRREDLFEGDREQYVLALRFFAGGLGMLYTDWFWGKIPVSFELLTEMVERILEEVLRSIRCAHGE